MNRLREIRRNRGLTQREISEQIGCSVGAYSKYETGSRDPSIIVLTRLADYYHVSVDYLIGRDILEQGSLTKHEEDVLYALRSSSECVRKSVYEIIMLLNKNSKID